MFCTTCATANAPDRRRCSGCGRGLALRSTGVQRQAAAPSPRGVRILLYRLPVLLLLALVGIAGVRYQHERAARAASYAAAETALAAGDYDAALREFAHASGYRDADHRYDAQRAMLQPYRLAYLAGVAALDARRYDEAIAALNPVVDALPAYRDAPALLAEARRQRDALLLGSVETAERQRDWLAAEQTLAVLTMSHPGDAALATRLRALRQDHAPMALARDDGLYLVGPDGADQRLLTNEVPAAMPTWDPARGRIAFLSPGVAPHHQVADLYVIGGDGTGLTKLTTGLVTGTVPCWDSTGTRIAFSRVGGGIGLVELTSGATTVIPSTSDITAISPPAGASSPVAFVASVVVSQRCTGPVGR